MKTDSNNGHPSVLAAGANVRIIKDQRRYSSWNNIHWLLPDVPTFVKE
jgi:hypothetical protein